MGEDKAKSKDERTTNQLTLLQLKKLFEVLPEVIKNKGVGSPEHDHIQNIIWRLLVEHRGPYENQWNELKDDNVIQRSLVRTEIIEKILIDLDLSINKNYYVRFIHKILKRKIVDKQYSLTEKPEYEKEKIKLSFEDQEFKDLWNQIFYNEMNERIRSTGDTIAIMSYLNGGEFSQNRKDAFSFEDYLCQ